MLPKGVCLRLRVEKAAETHCWFQWSHAWCQSGANRKDKKVVQDTSATQRTLLFGSVFLISNNVQNMVKLLYIQLVHWRTRVVRRAA